jgi:DNA-directed RNA polymerase specialized sigma24 family protein
MEPVSAEARRMARLRSDCDLSLLSTDDQARSEVARIVGKRPGAVRVLAHRGLRRLAKGWRRLGWRGV